MTTLSGRTALVLGGSRGVGKACAEALAAEGADVVIVARDSVGLERAADEIRRGRHGIHIQTVASDLLDPALERRLGERMLRPDIIITNCGRGLEGGARDGEHDDWRRAFNQMCLTPLFLVRRFMDAMCERNYGRVVNIVGSAVKGGGSPVAPANAARAALISAMGSLAREVARHNVTINSLLLGPTETEGLKEVWNQRAAMSDRSVDDIRRQALARIPAGRLGTPAEVAEFCAFLCRPNLGYVTAQSILLDGGAYPGIF